MTTDTLPAFKTISAVRRRREEADLASYLRLVIAVGSDEPFDAEQADALLLRLGKTEGDLAADQQRFRSFRADQAQAATVPKCDLDLQRAKSDTAEAERFVEKRQVDFRAAELELAIARKKAEAKFREESPAYTAMVESHNAARRVLDDPDYVMFRSADTSATAKCVSDADQKFRAAHAERSDAYDALSAAQDRHKEILSQFAYWQQIQAESSSTKTGHYPAAVKEREANLARLQREVKQSHDILPAIEILKNSADLFLVACEAAVQAAKQQADADLSGSTSDSSVLDAAVAERNKRAESLAKAKAHYKSEYERLENLPPQNEQPQQNGRQHTQPEPITSEV